MLSGSMKLAQQQTKQIPAPPKELNKGAIKPVQVGPQEAPGVQEARLLVETHRKNLVDTLRSTELKIRETRKLQQTKPELINPKELPKLVATQQDLNKQIKFVDSRLKDPRLTVAWADVLKNYEPPVGEAIKLPKKGIKLPRQGATEPITAPTFNDVINGNTTLQKFVAENVDKFDEEADTIINDWTALRYMDDDSDIKGIAKSLLNPVSWARMISDPLSNPNKFMYETFYNSVVPEATDEEKAQAKLASAMYLVGTIIPAARVGKAKFLKITPKELNALENNMARFIADEYKTNPKNLTNLAMKLNYSPTLLKQGVVQKVGLAGQAVKSTGQEIKAGVEKVLETPVPTTVPKNRRGQAGFIDFGPVVNFLKNAKKSDVEVLQNRLGGGMKSFDNAIRPFGISRNTSPIVQADVNALARKMFEDANKGIDVTSPSWSSGNPALDRYLRGMRGKFDKAYKSGSLVESDGVIFEFDQGLKDAIMKDLERNPAWYKKYVPSWMAAKTEKRVAEEVAPSLIPTLELRGQNLAEYNRRIAKSSKNYLAYSKWFQKNDADAQLMRDVLFAPNSLSAQLKIKNVLNSNISPETRKIFEKLNAKLNEIGRVAQLSTNQKGLDPNKSIFDNLIGVASENNVFGKAYSFKKFANKDRAMLEKQIDPIAVFFEMDDVLARRQSLQAPIATRQAAIDFIKQSMPNLTPEQQRQAQFMIDAMDDVQTQLANVAPEFDKQLAKKLPSAWTKIENLARTTGAAQIAGNVSTAMSQFIPLAYSTADIGVRNTLTGMLRAITNVKNDEFFKNSAFIANRLVPKAQEDLYKQLRSTYMKLNPTLSERMTKVYGEQIIDNISRATISQVDAFVTKSVWSAAYSRSLKAGMTKLDAARQADFVAERIMSDRSPGGLPAIMNTQFGKIVFQYGLETLNQPNLIKDFVNNRGGNAAQKAINAAVAATKYGIAAYMLNNGIEYVNNRRPAFDPIGLVDDYMKGQKGTTESQVGMGRARSATQIKTGTDLFNKAKEAIFGRANADLATSPALGFVGTDKPLGKLLAYAFQSVINRDITPSQQPEQFQKELALDLLFSTGTQFLKGGAQVAKTINGMRAIFGSYFDPKYTRIEDMPQVTPDDIDRWLKSTIGKQITNKYNQKEKAVKFTPMEADAVRALIFGPKSTGQYRTKVYSKQDYENQISKLKQVRDKFGDPDNRQVFNDLINILVEARKLQVVGPEYPALKTLQEK